MTAVEEPSASTGEQHIQPRLLIEEWLPAAAIGVECIRERSTGQQPPHARLHVWWARRPLAASRAAVLASVLPADFDRATFERLLGFDAPSEAIVRGQELLQWARTVGRQVPNPHGKRAFSNTLPEPHLNAAHHAMKQLWGELPAVIDPMAGGGSIPLESARLGLPTVANEYNPVACAVLEATVDYPFRFGPELAERARKWGSILRERFVQRMQRFYPDVGALPTHTYIFARTVPCPDTGAPTPLVPDWHLSKPKSGTHIVAEPVVDHAAKSWTVRIREIGRAAGQLPAAPKPTYVRGKATSIFTGAVIDGEYIKAMAKQGKLGSQLYAVVLKGAQGLDYRPAEHADLDAIAAAEAELARLRPTWERDNIIPTELYPRVSSELRPLQYGMPRWADMFSPRQLLAMGVLVEELRNLRPEILEAEGEEQGRAVEHLLAFVLDKFLNHNALLASWDSGTYGIRSVFDRHDFSFKPTPAEMAPCGAGAGLEWALGNVLKSWRELAELPRTGQMATTRITLGSATNLASVADASLTAVVVDPPYADNVQYSELADFFYVWLKRTVGHQHPDWFSSYLCDHSEEAVVNATRFVPDFDPDVKLPTGAKAAAKREAEAFYRDLMVQAFREAHRILRDDGVLTVMFTHKQQSAWESLFGALLEAGFVITATWPVKTESETSLHIASKNAAESTVILVARKRPAGAGIGYFTQEMKDRIRAVAKASAECLRNDGLNAVDQLVGSFGPAMEVFSRYREVRRDTGELVGIAEALDEASDAVVQWRVEKLMARGTGAELAGVEPMGRYLVLCWDVLAAAEFRFNEAKLLGHAVGLSPEDLVKAGLAVRKSQNIVLLPARDRRRDQAILAGNIPTAAQAKQLHPNDAEFRSAADAAHALAIAHADAGGGAAGIGAARALANRHNWRESSAVARLVQALVLSAPKGVQVEGKGITAKYPEFLAWHSLLQPLWGVTPPDWSEQEPVHRQFPGFATGAFVPEDEDADDEDIEDDESGDD